MLREVRHGQAAETFLSFLRSVEGQDAYAKFGFVKARDDSVNPKSIG
jgi:ABC-type Fe3+ transport system substrate-binding protein